MIPATASSTAAISASVSSGGLAVLVSSGAATAASTFSGPASPGRPGGRGGGTSVSPAPGLQAAGHRHRGQQPQRPGLPAPRRAQPQQLHRQAQRVPVRAQHHLSAILRRHALQQPGHDSLPGVRA